MSKLGIILHIEDDEDDRFFFKEMIESVGVKNEIVAFDNVMDALNFLDQTTRDIFIIFSDINLPGRTGLELKRDIDENPVLKRKSVPFIFYSTVATEKQVEDAYTNMTVQGYFKKPTNYAEAKDDLRIIFDYWSRCAHPNSR